MNMQIRLCNTFDCKMTSVKSQPSLELPTKGQTGKLQIEKQERRDDIF